MSNKERFERQLKWAANIAAKKQAKKSGKTKRGALTVHDLGKMGAAARWDGHVETPTTPIRVATHIVDRIKAEVPRNERRVFVDGALLDALSSRP